MEFFNSINSNHISNIIEFGMFCLAARIYSLEKRKLNEATQRRISISQKAIFLITFIGFIGSFFNLMRFPDPLVGKWDVVFISLTVFIGLLNFFLFMVNLYEWWRERH